MTNSSRSKKPKKKNWYENQGLIIAVLGVVTALISVSPQILQAFQRPEHTQTPIPATATLEKTPTLMPTSTETEIPFTATVSATPTDTATPTPISPPISCLDRWQVIVISSDQDLAETTSQDGCDHASVPALGISSSKAGISFGINNSRNQGTFGIATSLPVDATITLQLDIPVLTQGEFWIALSNTPNPENNMMIMAIQQNTGEVRFYSDQTTKFNTKYLWKELLTNTNLTSNSPFSYKITLATSGNRVNPRIYFTDLQSQVVNLPKYLFIGYNNKSALGSVSLQAEITDLTVEVK